MDFLEDLFEGFERKEKKTTVMKTTIIMIMATEMMHMNLLGKISLKPLIRPKAFASNAANQTRQRPVFA